MTDEFLGVLQRGIISRHFHLSEDRHYIPGASRFPQRVLKRLLQHVPDPTCCAGDKDAEWKGRDLRASLFVPYELVSDLRSITVHDYHPPAIEREIDDRPQTFAAVAELVGNGRALTRWRKRVPSDRYHS